MTCRIEELSNKEVICIDDGSLLGFVTDVEVETCSGKTVSITVQAQGGLSFHKKRCYKVCWCDIVVIGAEAILVKNAELLQEIKSAKKILDIFSK